MNGRATHLIAGLLLSGCASAAMAETALFVDNFESRSVGSLAGQGGWAAQPAGRAQAQTAIRHAGEKGAQVGTGAMISRAAPDATATNVWVDFYARTQPRHVTRPPCLAADAVAGFYLATNGWIVAHSNLTWVTNANYKVRPNEWFRFSVNLNYKTRRWAIHVATNVQNRAGVPVATNLAFAAGVTNRHFQAFRVKN